METMKTTVTTKLDASMQNIEQAIETIKAFASSRGHEISGEFATGTLSFESKSKEKVLRNYLTRLQRKPGMAIANRLLHFLYKKVYKMDEAPRVVYSEKAVKIQAARDAWKAMAAEVEKLRLAYKLEKGDYYKNK